MSNFYDFTNTKMCLSDCQKRAVLIFTYSVLPKVDLIFMSCAKDKDGILTNSIVYQCFDCDYDDELKKAIKTYLDNNVIDFAGVFLGLSDE